jgi:hypothetical protein
MVSSGGHDPLKSIDALSSNRLHRLHRQQALAIDEAAQPTPSSSSGRSFSISRTGRADGADAADGPVVFGC